MIKAYKYRLYPTKEQEVLLSKHFGCVRFIYNWGLDLKTKYYKETNKNIGYMQILDLSTIRDINSASSALTVTHLSAIFKNLDSTFL